MRISELLPPGEERQFQAAFNERELRVLVEGVDLLTDVDFARKDEDEETLLSVWRQLVKAL